MYIQFLYDTVPSEESDSNIEIEFAERASPNRESDVVEVEENGNAVVEKEVTPPEKKNKKKFEPYQNESEIKLNKTREIKPGKTFQLLI